VQSAGKHDVSGSLPRVTPTALLRLTSCSIAVRGNQQVQLFLFLASQRRYENRLLAHGQLSTATCHANSAPQADLLPMLGCSSYIACRQLSVEPPFPVTYVIGSCVLAPAPAPAPAGGGM